MKLQSILSVVCQIRRNTTGSGSDRTKSNSKHCYLSVLANILNLI